MSVKFSSIIIGTRDIESAKEFYQNVFDFKIVTQSPYYLSGNIGNIHVEIEEDAPYRLPGWTEHNI
jgi:catechol 2,3-dioxygenase-like lactoylglutathione lyase family enzyme